MKGVKEETDVLTNQSRARKRKRWGQLLLDKSERTQIPETESPFVDVHIWFVS